MNGDFFFTIDNWTVTITIPDPSHMAAALKAGGVHFGTREIEPGSTTDPEPPKTLLRLRDYLRMQGLTDCEVATKGEFPGQLLSFRDYTIRLGST